MLTSGQRRSPRRRSQHVAAVALGLACLGATSCALVRPSDEKSESAPGAAHVSSAGTPALARRGIAIWEQVPSARVVRHDVASLTAPSRRLPRPLGRRCGLGRRPKHHAAAHPRSAAKQRCGHARATRLRQVGLGGRAGSLSGVGEAHILTLPGDLGAFAARARRAGRGRGGASRLPFGFHMCIHKAACKLRDIGPPQFLPRRHARRGVGICGEILKKN